jgi:hypothetical protein
VLLLPAHQLLPQQLLRRRPHLLQVLLTGGCWQQIAATAHSTPSCLRWLLQGDQAVLPELVLVQQQLQEWVMVAACLPTPRRS